MFFVVPCSALNLMFADIAGKRKFHIDIADWGFLFWTEIHKSCGNLIKFMLLNFMWEIPTHILNSNLKSINYSYRDVWTWSYTASDFLFKNTTQPCLIDYCSNSSDRQSD